MATVRFDCAEVHDLAGLFVLDALSADESAGVRDHLATCDQPHEEFAVMASATGALADAIEPAAPPADLRDRVMAAVAATPQVPDDVKVVVRPQDGLLRPVAVPRVVAPSPTVSEPISIDAARQRRGPSRMAWVGLAAAAAIVIAALGAWNLSLQRQVSDAQGRVASLQQEVAVAQQEATQAGAQVASLQGQIAEGQAQLAAAIQRADVSDAQLTSLQKHIDGMQVEMASYQQQIATADDQVALIGHAIAAATNPASNVATLASTSPDGTAAGMAIFPSSGTGYIMIEGLPELGPDQTYEAWYLAGGTPTAAGVMAPGSHGLAIMAGLDPISGTDSIALTIEPAGGVDQPTGPRVIEGTLPSAVAFVATTALR